eukprot:Cvel_22452.t2-p1 / transcript=Cvel_22452.t2 / gene=Cvel_22452 / organism=Chromera_velia_CCMP2878 / gene_product=hypothetical protein / transcript_product=hypothetical protein / location=Cvel_scaffold2207:13491-15314(-) / protein_length=608 / sequence_SO=supercontig / SO=protein_coding / is_pseudo=false
MNVVNMSTILSRLRLWMKDTGGQRDFVHRPEFQALLEALCEQIRRGMAPGPRQLCNTLHNLAVLGLLRDRRVSECGSGRVSSLHETVHRLCAEIVKLSEWIGREGISTHLAMSVWACATMRLPAPPLFDAVVSQRDRLAREGGSQDHSLTLWAFATAGVRAVSLFQSIDAHCDRTVREGIGQHIANSVWSFAVLRINCPGFARRLEETAESFVKRAAPNDLAITAWAMAVLGERTPRLLAAVLGEGRRIVSTGAPKNIATTTWAFSEALVDAGEFCALVDSHASRIVREGKVIDLVTLLTAFAHLGIRAPGLLEALSAYGGKRLLSEGCAAQEFANTLWAVAVLGDWGRVESGVLEELDSRLVSLLLATERGGGASVPVSLSPSSSPLLQESQLSQWHSFRLAAALEAPHLKLRHPPEELCRHRPHSLSQSEGLCEHGREQKFCKECGGAATAIESGTAGVRGQAETGIESTSRSPSIAASSYTHGDVSRSLLRLGWQHQVEIPVVSHTHSHQLGWQCDTKLYLDCACPETRVAIEVQGPSHFLRDLEGRLTRRQTGRTLFKNRMTRKLGWRLVEIDLRDWGRHRSEDARFAFLLEKLRSVGADIPCT